MEKIYKNKEGKTAGILIGSIYQKTVNRSKHLMKMFNGYGLDVNIFDDLKKLGCTEIKIIEIDTGKILNCPFSLFEEKKIMKQFDGPQYFIQGKYLNNGEEPKQLNLA